MDRLTSHFSRMQEMASRYLEPCCYTGLHGTTACDDRAKRLLFINDMIEMLDRPDQRAAQDKP